MGLLYRRAGRLTALFGGFRPGQVEEDSTLSQVVGWVVIIGVAIALSAVWVYIIARRISGIKSRVRPSSLGPAPHLLPPPPLPPGWVRTSGAATGGGEPASDTPARSRRQTRNPQGWPKFWTNCKTLICSLALQVEHRIARRNLQLGRAASYGPHAAATRVVELPAPDLAAARDTGEPPPPPSLPPRLLSLSLALSLSSPLSPLQQR
jgi:hypothetical protein